MKKLLFLALAAMLLTGCTEEYYQQINTAAQINSQNYIAYLEFLNSQPPTAEMKSPDGETVCTFRQQPNLPPPPQMIFPDHPAVAGIKAVVNSKPAVMATGGWAVGNLLKNATGDINASGGSTVTSTRNSYNPMEIRSADGNITEDQSNNPVTDSHDATATPTVVPASDPVIVPAADPVILDPKVVRPEIVPPAWPPAAAE